MHPADQDVHKFRLRALPDVIWDNDEGVDFPSISSKKLADEIHDRLVTHVGDGDGVSFDYKTPAGEWLDVDISLKALASRDKKVANLEKKRDANLENATTDAEKTALRNACQAAIQALNADMGPASGRNPTAADRKLVKDIDRLASHIKADRHNKRGVMDLFKSIMKCFGMSVEKSKSRVCAIRMVEKGCVMMKGEFSPGDAFKIWDNDKGLFAAIATAGAIGIVATAARRKI